MYDCIYIEKVKELYEYKQFAYLLSFDEDNRKQGLIYVRDVIASCTCDRCKEIFKAIVPIADSKRPVALVLHHKVYEISIYSNYGLIEFYTAKQISI